MRIRTLALAGTAVVLLAGCGEGGEEAGTSGSAAAGGSTAAAEAGELAGLTGPEVAAEAAAALEEAGSVTVQGTITEDGEELAVDLHLQGEDAVGSMTMGGQTVELLRAGGASYLQAPPEFWAGFGMPAEFADTFAGVWVLVPDEEGAGFGDLSLASFAGELTTPTSPIDEQVETGELGGEPVVVVTQEDGSTLSVAAEGPAYPLEATAPDGSGGTITFSRFGEEMDITAPADALDLTEFGA